ncbi:MAG: CbiQ family ECF transporter T component [Acidimicrobiales bacterium]
MSGGHDGGGRRGERVVGPLDRLAPEAKIAGLVGFLLMTAVTPPGRLVVLAAQGAVAVAVAMVAAVEPRALRRRLVLDAPLAVLALTYAVAGHGPRTSILGLPLSAAGLRVGSAALGKATIGIVSVSAVAAATPVTEVVAGLRRLGLPVWFCDLVGLSARQAGVLGGDLERLRLAAAVRGGGRGRRAEWAAVARSLGASFVRATERVDRLQLAAQARGGGSLGAVIVSASTVPVATAGTWALAALPALGALTARLVL